ncbi:MAG: nucleotidyltransferase domain-containing protein, partial [Alphaproteobacteria bacterium]
MPAPILLSLYQRLKEEGIKVWIDGGWGVDALLGEQTRPHGDLDLVVQERDLVRLVKILKS